MDLSLEVKNLESEFALLQKRLSQGGSVPVGDESPTHGIYAFKEKLLTAEINELQKGLEGVTFQQGCSSIGDLKHEIKQTDTQLGFTLSHELSSHTQLLQEKADNCKIFSEQNDIKLSLSQYIKTMADVVEKSDNSQQSTRVLNSFINNNKKANILRRNLILQMGEFLAETYPQPSPVDIEAFKKKRNKLFINNVSVGNNLKDLQEITELLMNKCLQDPNDPFINIDESFWPPYVELLFRMNVIQWHPSEARKIKLTPYHI